jgi:hypothetical protein
VESDGATDMFLTGYTRGISKVKNVLPLKIFDNRKEKEYAGFITHLHLLLHIVTLDIEALVVP